MHHLLKTVVLSLSCLGTIAFAAPPGIQTEQVVGGFFKPIAMRFLPDGQMLVLDFLGKIWRVDLEQDPPEVGLYLEIPDIEVVRAKGAWNLAIDPNFDEQPFVYVTYSDLPTDRFRVARFRHLGDTADPSSLLSLWQDNEQTGEFINHNGCGLDFGPDGNIYLTLGDEGAEEQSQDLMQSGGSVIRIDRLGVVPPDNPFRDGPGGNLDTIWAFGLRNPFRAKWDWVGNRYWIADVGHISWEELNLGVAGANYGWPECEGACIDSSPQCVCDPFGEPVYAYPRRGSGCIVGGVVFRGNKLPADPYYGAYFHADYMRNTIGYLTFDDTGNVVDDVEFDSLLRVTDLVNGPDGALYAVSFHGGSIHRYSTTDDNQAPIIDLADSNANQGLPPHTVMFSGNATDPENDPLSYRWIFGDGTDANGANASHTYTEAGRYMAYLEVHDGTFTTLSGPIEIEVGASPTLQIVEPVDGSSFQSPSIDLTALVDDPDGSLSEAVVAWRIRFYNDQQQVFLDEQIEGPTTSFQIPSELSFVGTSLEIIATIIDEDGLSVRDSVTIVPEISTLTIETQPAGLDLLVNGERLVTPASIDGLIGQALTLGAPDQCVDGTPHIFQDWSNGLDQVHPWAFPDMPQTLSASFAPNEILSPDINVDGEVGVADLVQIILQWGECVPDQSCLADLDCTGVVNVIDLLQVVLNWNS